LLKKKIDNLINWLFGREINPSILQFFRYLISGGVATMTDVSALFVLTHFFHVHYLLAAAFAFLSGTTVNYFLNITIVFESSGQVQREFPLFAMIGMGGLLWTEVILWILVDKIGFYVMLAKIVAIILVLNWNFFMRKKFVFREGKSKSVKLDDKRNRVLMIAATPFFSDRGCHIRIYNMAKYLNKFGLEVRVCTYFNGSDVEGINVKRIKNVSWYKRVAPGFSWGKLWLDIKLIFLCCKQIMCFQPNVIIAHMYEGLGIGYMAKKLAFSNVPIITDLQAELEEEFLNYNKNLPAVIRSFFVCLSKIFINRCDWITISSENVEVKIRNVFKRKDRITIVSDGIDLDMFERVFRAEKSETNNQEKAIADWKGEKKLLVYIGGLSENKGIGKLIRSFGKIVSDKFDWKLLVGGFGEDEEELKKFVLDHNLGNYIYFLGRVSYFDLPIFLAMADAGIDPKYNSTESSGKLANLMAARLPIICFDNVYNRSRLEENGYYLKDFFELEKVLAKIGREERINYNLEDLAEEKEIAKLSKIIERLIIKSNKR